MSRSLDQEIRAFERRVDAYAFLGGAAEGLLAGAVGVLAVVLVLRLLQLPFAPPLWLLAPVGAAALLGGLGRLRRLRFDAGDSAAHLDRRLGLEGLLLASRETDAGAWQGRLDAGLQEARAAKPHLAPQPLLGRIALAAAALAVVFFLPPATAKARAMDRLAEETLEEFEARLEKLEEERGLDEDAAEELRARYEDLRAEQEDTGTIAWSDFDALEARMEHEEDLKTGRLAKAAAAMSEMAADANAGDRAATPEAFDELMALAEAAGLLDQLPQDLKEQLGQGVSAPGGEGGGEGAGEGEGLALDAETLAQLAAALAGLAGQELTGLADAGLLEGLSPEELQKLLEGVLAAATTGQPCKLCDGESDDDCPG